jgi:type I restriction-modification system DNA methylase subunit
MGNNGEANYLIDENKLDVFDQLNRDIFRQLIGDFYLNHRSAPYQYDFSLMSKHALSRIYEHYISLVRDIESNQISFFPQTPEELIDHRLGGIYTPQYVARFFGRFLQNDLSPRQFRNISLIDPACGSGIFPRTILEMQFDPWNYIGTNLDPASEFQKILAIDVDPNAESIPFLVEIPFV